MADFFSRLVDRSLGLGSAVQPAIAPRFSSATAIANEIDLQGNRDAQPLVARPSILPAAPRSIDGSPPQPHSAAVPFSAPELDISPYSVSEHPGVQPPLSIPAAQSGLSLQPPAARLEPKALSQTASPEPFRVVQSSDSENHPPLPTTALPNPHANRLPSPSIAPDESIAEVSRQVPFSEPFRVAQPPDSGNRYPFHPLRTIAQSNDELPDKSAGVSHPAVIQSTASQAYIDRSTVSRSGARIDLPATKPTAQISEESAALPPTIRVSIGRVEVRAIMPTPPAPKATPVRHRPAVSLDAYLQRRGGNHE